jgi:hypothetical protein
MVDGRCLLLLQEIGKTGDVPRKMNKPDQPAPTVFDSTLASRIKFEDESGAPGPIPGLPNRGIIREVRSGTRKTFIMEHGRMDI